VARAAASTRSATASAFVLISSFASGSQVFVEPTVLSTGAPGQISPTWSVNQLAYVYATQDGDFGKAAALSLALLAVGVLAAWIVITRTRMYATDSSDSR
jgi:multiple sugar transport system permease protein